VREGLLICVPGAQAINRSWARAKAADSGHTEGMVNASSVKQRLKKLEDRLHPPHDEMFTLEELCRSMWEKNRKHFLELAEWSKLVLFAKQFELDEAERDRTRAPAVKGRVHGR